jgi:hypothetical protein
MPKAAETGPESSKQRELSAVAHRVASRECPQGKVEP